jgi:transposase-like protein
MEVQVGPDGRKVWPTELKKRVLSLLDAGRPPAEVSRECQVPIQNIHRWRHEQKKGRNEESFQPFLV